MTNVFPNNLTEFNLFDRKPTIDGATPLVFSLTVEIADQPPRAPGNPYSALDVAAASQLGLYSVVGDHVGHVAISSVQIVNNPVVVGQPATATITVNFAQPLPDDRFTLTILDGVIDPAGNLLDGESDAADPRPPRFPTGNGVPGGDFVARFTVDSRPEIGSTVAADVDLDINGNFVWDPANAQIGNDATNVDLSFTVLVQNGVGGPLATGGLNVNDLLFSGKFTNGGTLPARLFDQLGAFGYAADLASPGYRWLIDTNGDGVITLGGGSTDRLVTQPSTVLGFNVAGAIPVAGNFDGNAANGDEIGLYSAGKWAIDKNHDFVLDTILTGNLLGTPIVGDFDGNGTDDLAVFNNNVFSIGFNLSPNSSTQMTWGFPGVLDKPIAADMDQDGIDDIGLWVPRNSASLPEGVAEWYFLVSGTPTAPLTAATTTTLTLPNLINNSKVAAGQLVRIRNNVTGAITYGIVSSFALGTGVITLTSALGTAPAVGSIISVGGTVNSINTVNHAFNIAPFGNDIAAEFGDELALPIVGNFDPPATPTVIAPNSGVAGDYDNSGYVSASDFNVWRATFGSTGSNLLADGNHNGQVDAADYVLWRNSYSAGGAGSSTLVDVSGSTSLITAAVLDISAASTTDSLTSFVITTSSEEPDVSVILHNIHTLAVKPTELDKVFDTLSIESNSQATFANFPAVTLNAANNELLLLIANKPVRQSPYNTVPMLEDAPVDESAIDTVLSEWANDQPLHLAV